MADTLPDTVTQGNAASPESRLPGGQHPAPAAAAPAGEDPAAPPEAAVNLDTLELTVTFELDRRLMSIAEIAALTPGYTFTLPADMGGPVTVRANGKSLGKGRLVDVGGVLGVQLVSLEREK